MALSREDLEQVGVYVRSHLNEWLPREVFDLQERIIRVEDELKAQREVMVTRFDAVDQRFEDMNQRFEDMNQRFEDTNKRFEDMNRQFEAANKRFEDTNKRFEDTNQRFEDTNKRFEDMNRRFEAQQAVMDRHFRFHQWTVTGGVLLLTTLMTLYRFLG